MRRSVFGILFVGLLAVSTACKEDTGVKVNSLKFNGVEAIDEGRLREALATAQSSKLPWGKKAYFDRARFEADVKRMQAFYADRGYPDARVTGFDVKLNDKQNAVDLTVTISEGEPVTVAAVNFVGFEVVPADHVELLERQMPLKIGQPRDRQLVVQTHELALNELKDHGYP
jgi:outer membrane protein insertion porin family